MAIARNSTPISRAVPGTDRNRTRLNAPATATPTPTLPLTSMITSCTTAGRIAAVMAKLCVQRERYIATPAVASPSARDTAVQIRKPESVSVEPRMELSTV